MLKIYKIQKINRIYQGGRNMKSTFKIKGIDCANCAAQLENAIKKIKGVKSASISFMAERMVIEYEDKNKDEIIKNIKKVTKREEPDATIEQI